MIIWINGSFGVGKTETANILNRRLPRSHIYDPEQAGAFLWDSFPKEMQRRGDFQDIPLWRKINFDVIKYMYESYGGDIIIPMTLVNKTYFDEIVGALLREGVQLRHFILTASKEAVISRLLRRGEPRGCWAELQFDRCAEAFDSDIEGLRIDTTYLEAEAVAEVILEKCRHTFS